MQRYRLIFEGQLQPQAERAKVIGALARLFNAEPAQIEALFANPPVVLKENLTYEEALRDKAEFENTGALCRLETRAARSTVAAWDRDDQSAGSPPGSETAPPSAGRRFKLYHPYYLAFFSRAFYADVAMHWRGLAFVHLLLVLVLCSAVYMIHFHGLLTMLIAEEAPAIVAQIPDITIEKGKVRVNVDQPYTIHRPDSGEAFAVIDTTGQITSLRQTDAAILLTQSRLAARLSAGDSRILDLRQIESMRIDRFIVSQWLQQAQTWSPFILYPLALGFAFIFRSIQAVFYGGLGMFVASMHRIRLPFQALVSVAIMAMTPFLLLDALLVLLDVYLPLWGAGGFLIAMGYLVFGIRSVTREP